jgi:hypothetical protein
MNPCCAFVPPRVTGPQGPVGAQGGPGPVGATGPTGPNRAVGAVALYNYPVQATSLASGAAYSADTPAVAPGSYVAIWQFEFQADALGDTIASIAATFKATNGTGTDGAYTTNFTQNAGEGTVGGGVTISLQLSIVFTCSVPSTLALFLSCTTVSGGTWTIDDVNASAFLPGVSVLQL